MLENTEGSNEKNGQSRDTGNIGYTREDKQNKNITMHKQTQITKVFIIRTVHIYAYI